MSFENLLVIQVRCDNCRALFDPWDEGVVIRETAAELKQVLIEDTENAGFDPHWTEDGHGRHHCDGCPPLILDPEIAAERAADAARKLTETDVPLDLDDL